MVIMQSLDFLPIIILKCHPLLYINIHLQNYFFSLVPVRLLLYLYLYMSWGTLQFTIKFIDSPQDKLNRYSYYFFVVSLFILNLYMTWGSTQQNSLKVLSIKSTDTVAIFELLNRILQTHICTRMITSLSMKCYHLYQF